MTEIKSSSGDQQPDDAVWEGNFQCTKLYKGRGKSVDGGGSRPVVVAFYGNVIFPAGRMMIINKNKVDRFHRQIATTSLRFSDELAVHRDSPENNATTPFEFTEPNLARIAAQIQNYPEGCHRSALGAALDIAQRQMGWLPISAMHKVAEILSIPRVRVYEYATFYTMNKRHSRGKYHVKICATTPCMLMGAESILMAAEDACGCKAGSVSSDGMFGVDTVECAGACVNAPVLVIDDDYYEDLTVGQVQEIIQTIRCGGIPPPGPRNGRFSCEPLCGPTSLIECPPPPGFGIQKGLTGK